ncbi:MAG: 6,7-dimethyl-8-ribityllumazine synthase [Candidatus Micrarchaeota archaeon]
MRQGFEDEGEWGKKKQIRFGFVVGEFEKEITEFMVNVAKKTCTENKIEIGEIIFVPGCFDIPLAVKKLLLDKRNDAIVTLGAVIKGETKHDEVIANSTANQLSRLSLEFNMPVTLGIIGPGANEKQAEERKEEYARNAVIAAIKLCQRLR